MIGEGGQGDLLSDAGIFVGETLNHKRKDIALNQFKDVIKKYGQSEASGYSMSTKHIQQLLEDPEASKGLTHAYTYGTGSGPLANMDWLKDKRATHIMKLNNTVSSTALANAGDKTNLLWKMSRP